MPALLTHYLCGDAALKLLEKDSIASCISRHRNAYNLGTQGPDFFFYYGAWPWVKDREISGFGERMHEEKTGEFIIEALRYGLDCSESSRGIIASYMYGYLCHYALDCHAHPYVFYKTGFLRENEEYTPKYTVFHRMFETSLDVLMLERQMKRRPSEFNAPALIRVPKQEAATIGEMYSRVLGSVFGMDINSESVCRAIADMADITAVLRDTTGIKKKLMSGIEKFLGKPPMYSSMIMPLYIRDGIDYLNTSRSLWHLPWDSSADLSLSFIDIFEAAVSESKILIETDIDAVSALIGSRSFSTGEDHRLNLKFKYFDCVYE